MARSLFVGTVSQSNESPVKPALPGYWTPSEIADRLGKTSKWVLHRIRGRGRPPELKAYQVQRLYFIPDADAEAFIERHS